MAKAPLMAALLALLLCIGVNGGIGRASIAARRGSCHLRLLGLQGTESLVGIQVLKLRGGGGGEEEAGVEEGAGGAMDDGDDQVEGDEEGQDEDEDGDADSKSDANSPKIQLLKHLGSKADPRSRKGLTDEDVVG